MMIIVPQILLPWISKGDIFIFPIFELFLVLFPYSLHDGSHACQSVVQSCVISCPAVSQKLAIVPVIISHWSALLLGIKGSPASVSCVCVLGIIQQISYTNEH